MARLSVEELQIEKRALQDDHDAVTTASAGSRPRLAGSRPSRSTTSTTTSGRSTTRTWLGALRPQAAGATGEGRTISTVVRDRDDNCGLPELGRLGRDQRARRAACLCTSTKVARCTPRDARAVREGSALPALARTLHGAATELFAAARDGAERRCDRPTVRLPCSLRSISPCHESVRCRSDSGAGDFRPGATAVRERHARGFECSDDGLDLVVPNRPRGRRRCRRGHGERDRRTHEPRSRACDLPPRTRRRAPFQDCRAEVGDGTNDGVAAGFVTGCRLVSEGTAK